MRRLLVPALLLVLVLSACVPTAPGATGSPVAAPEKVQITAATKGELETVLNRRLQAISRNDLSAYQSTYDQTRLALRRCLQEDFEVAARGSVAPVLTRGSRIVKVEPYGDVYARAYVEEGSLGIGRRYFTRQDGRWVQTEPRDTELGPERKKSVDGVTVEYWAVDDDIIDLIAKGSIANRDFLKQHEPPQKTDIIYGVRAYPTREAVSIRAACRSLASTGDRNDPLVRLYGVWLAPSLADLSDDMKGTLRHEGLHSLQEQFNPGIFARLFDFSWWLVEGWPEHVSSPDRLRGLLRSVLCGGKGFSFKEISGGPESDDPVRPPERAIQMYSYAGSLIEYLLATYGTKTYWELVGAHAETVDVNVIYPKVLKTSGGQFFADWQAWAKKKAC